jgi:hypothetical protein
MNPITLCIADIGAIFCAGLTLGMVGWWAISTWLQYRAETRADREADRAIRDWMRSSDSINSR